MILDPQTTSDTAVLALIGRRIARHRLNRGLTQAALALEAGVSTATLQRLEAGHAGQTDNFVRVLRALDLLANLDALIPDPPESPLLQVKAARRKRRRARATSDGEPWTWGDDA
jgi:transcriptional regulator with XRE-family HTH domain